MKDRLKELDKIMTGIKKIRDAKPRLIDIEKLAEEWVLKNKSDYKSTYDRMRLFEGFVAGFKCAKGSKPE